MLSIFNESNGVYCGSNGPQFQQIEYMVTNSVLTNTQIPNLGLFGSASVGKTMSAKLIAKYSNYHFLYLNSVTLNIKNINSILFNALSSLCGNDWSYKFDNRTPNKTICFSNKPILILLDEAHELNKNVQTILLSSLEEKGPFYINNNEVTFDTSNITWIFATTDSSKLLYPLVTRLNTIIFDNYTKEDIANIIALKYKNIDPDGRLLLARCSKLVPRIALRYSEQINNTYISNITKENIIEYIKNTLNMTEDGLDNIDKKILLYLNNKKINSQDETILKFLNTEKEKLENNNLTSIRHKEYNSIRFKITVLENKVNNAEYIVKSRQDISLGCRILDLQDLEIRLSYLEINKYIEKTNKGIRLLK